MAVQFQEAEFEKNIQTFFTLRKEAVMDMCKSFGPMFSQAQWHGLKNAGPEQITCAISRFYANRITLEPPGEQIPFCWNVYQNTSQKCY